MGGGKCPERILGNAIHGLVCGLVGGAIYVGAAGVMRGHDIQKTVGTLTTQVPMIAVQVCVLCAVYSAIECGLRGATGKNDMTNVLVSGAITGALFGAARGPQAMAINCAVGAALAGIFDGNLV